MIKLLSFTLNNFKGIRNFNLKLNGQDANIYGDNEAGKTTLYDAYSWLFHGKDSFNRSNFGIKTLDNGEVIHGLDHEVEAVLSVSGRVITLKKVYYEKWTKPTEGGVDRVLTGHTTSYYIDEVPYSEKEYKAKVSEIADEDTFRLLTNSSYFSEILNWKDRRKILLEVCGDISDRDIIASDVRLAKLSDILELRRSVEDHRKVISEKRTRLNKELEKIPIRIDEVYMNISDIKNLDFESIKKEIDELSSTQDEYRQTLSRIENGGEIARKETELANLETRSIRLNAIHEEGKYKALKELQDQAHAISNNQIHLKSELRKNQSKIDFLKKKITSSEISREILLKEWHTENERAFEFIQEDICPTCEQYIPIEKVEKARNDAIKAYNLAKSKKLENISGRGKKVAGELAEHKASHDSLVEKVSRLRTELDKVNESLQDNSGKIAIITDEVGKVEDTQEYKDLAEEIKDIKDTIKSLKDENEVEVTKINKSISNIDQKIIELQIDLAKEDANKKSQARILELQSEERALAEELEGLDEQIYLTEEFIKVKVNLLESAINSKFKVARFKLFETQVNGKVNPVCETLYEGVPYGDLNNAARINVGLDIINTLSKHYDCSAPIFVDNSEGVSEICEVDSQLIKLIKPPSFEQLEEEIQGLLISKYESYDKASKEYNSTNNKLRVKLIEDTKLEEVA